jgi:hypothetical protein
MRRAAQERSAATNATADKAREAHEKMAKRYRELVGAGAEGQTETAQSR